MKFKYFMGTKISFILKNIYINSLRICISDLPNKL